MSDSFNDMMRREFGDDFGEVPEIDGELLELYKRFCQLSRHLGFLQLAVYTHPSERRVRNEVPLLPIDSHDRAP